MGCNSTPFIYVANEGVSNILTNAIIPLGNVVREQTNCCNPKADLDGTGIVCSGSKAPFHVTGHITLAQVDESGSTPPAISIELLQNGSTVQGSKVVSNSSGQVTLPIDSVIRNDCCSSSVLTLKNTGVAVNLVYSALTVKPI